MVSYIGQTRTYHYAHNNNKRTKKGDISCEIFLVLPLCHENEQIMRFFFLSWWVTQVYNKTVIALYLDFIHSYLFCFYFDSANASSK